MDYTYAVEWLYNSQNTEDGSWGDPVTLREIPFPPDGQVKHRIVYTSQIVKTLSMFQMNRVVAERALGFLRENEVSHNLYKYPLRIIAYTAMGEHDAARELCVRLVGLIQRGGAVQFEGRQDSQFFDACIALDSLLQCSDRKEFLGTERVKDLVHSLAKDLDRGDNPNYWIWRAGLIATVQKVKRVINLQLEADLKAHCLSLLSSVVDVPWRRMFEQAPVKTPTITPNLRCDEYRIAHAAMGLVNLHRLKWIGATNKVTDLVGGICAHMLDNFEVGGFTSYTVNEDGSRRGVSDPYMSSLMLMCLRYCYRSALLAGSPFHGELYKFFSGTPTGDALDSRRLAMLRESLVSLHSDLAAVNCGAGAVADEVVRAKDSIQSFLKTPSGPQITVEISQGLPGLFKLLSGLDAKVKFTAGVGAEQMPNIARYLRQFQKLLGKPITHLKDRQKS